MKVPMDRWIVEVGDVVQPTNSQWMTMVPSVGMVVDTMEMEDGEIMCEILFENEKLWFDQLELKLISRVE